MTFRHDLKSLECSISAGGCGMKFTLPPEHNTIHEEFKSHRVIIHGYKPQMIDKKSKELREMNESELVEHRKRISDIVDKQLKEDQKKYPHNKITVEEDIIDDHIRHVFTMEPVYGIVETEKKPYAIVTKKMVPDTPASLQVHEEGEDVIFEDREYTKVKCPKCGKVILDHIDVPSF